jgi:hypothetical protein
MGHGNAMIADFVLDKMSNYIAGGMKPETAARFTRGELSAIYEGDHHSRNGTGKWHITPPLETLTILLAKAKCEAFLLEILKYYVKNEKDRNAHGTTQKNVPVTQDKSSFEKMAEYAGMKTA